jgi:hypothetical protein
MSRGLDHTARFFPSLIARLSSFVDWTMNTLLRIRYFQTHRSLVHFRSLLPILSLAAMGMQCSPLTTFEVADSADCFINCETIEYETAWRECV